MIAFLDVDPEKSPPPVDFCDRGGTPGRKFGPEPAQDAPDEKWEGDRARPVVNCHEFIQWAQERLVILDGPVDETHSA